MILSMYLCYFPSCLVPQQGDLSVDTELGKLFVSPNEICVIPRGIKFSIKTEKDGIPIRGYVLEVFNGQFELPDLGPIGANGLANPRDFLYPVAAFEDCDHVFSIYNKYNGFMFVCHQVLSRNDADTLTILVSYLTLEF